MIDAVNSGVAWLKGAALSDVAYGAAGDPSQGRRLVAKPGAGPLWARYFSVAAGKPVFGDRDKTIHDDVNELTLERRNGYAWYNNAPLKAFDSFAAWSKMRPKA